MACNLFTVAHLEFPNHLQSWLCPNLKSRSSSSQNDPFDKIPDSAWEDGWENDTGAGKDEEMLNESSSNDRSWLTECLVSVNPIGDTVVLTNENRVCIFTGVWEVPENEKEQYTMKLSWKGQLDSTLGPITSVLCLPISSLQRTSTGVPDFNTVMVCHKSGAVRWYTLNGALLLHKEFESPGTAVTSVEVRGSTCNSTEYVCILYPKLVVTIEVAQLVTILRMCVNKLAKASAGDDSSSSNLETPLPHKKWLLTGQSSEVNSASVSGTTKDSLYDMMVQSSLCQEPFNRNDARVAVSTPGVTVMTAGQEPYAALMVGRDLRPKVQVSDMAKYLVGAITTKVLSSASSYIPFMGTKTPEEKVVDKVEAGKPTPYLWWVPEGRRTGVSVSVSPNPQIAAVTDTFGRVVLFDLKGGYATRMWKGYRDAVISWVYVHGAYKYDSEFKEGVRSALFLVIHAPRRGLLEVWPALGGKRVAAFNVHKTARLVHVPYGVIGASRGTTTAVSTHPLYMVSTDGSIQSLHVPFHLVLSNISSSKTKDLNILKSFKSAIKGGTEEEALQYISDLQTSLVRYQALCFLVYCPYQYSLDLMKKVLQLLCPIYLNKTFQQLVSEQMDQKARLLHQSQHKTNSDRNEKREKDGVREAQVGDKESPSGDSGSQVGDSGSQEEDKQAPLFQYLLRNLFQLVRFYEFLMSMHKEDENCSTKDDLEVEEKESKTIMKEVAFRLSLQEDEVLNVLSMSDEEPTSTSKVRFDTGTDAETAVLSSKVNFGWFMRTFDLGITSEKKQTEYNSARLMMEEMHRRFLGSRKSTPSISESMGHEMKEGATAECGEVSVIELQKVWSLERKIILTRFLFSWQFSKERMDSFHRSLYDSGINCVPLVKILFHYWNTLPHFSSDRTHDSKHDISFQSTMSEPMDCDENDSPLKAKCDVSAITPVQLSKCTAIIKVAMLLSSLVSVREFDFQSKADTHNLNTNQLRIKLANSSKLLKAYIMCMMGKTVNTTIENRFNRGSKHWISLINECSGELTSSDNVIMKSQSSDSVKSQSCDTVAMEVNDAKESAESEECKAEYFSRVDLFREMSHCMQKYIVSDDSNLSDWESSSVEANQWAVVLRQIERILPLERLLKLKLERCKYESTEATVKMLIGKGRGGVSEVVSNWLVRISFTSAECNLMVKYLDNHIQHTKKMLYKEREGESPPAAPVGEDSPEKIVELFAPQDLPHWNSDLLAVYCCLLSLSVNFPENLSAISLLPTISWEYSAAWLQSPNKVELLKYAVDVATCIPNCHVMHGVCTLMWEKLLSDTFRRLSELTERFSGPMTAKHSTTKLRMSLENITPFLLSVKRLLTLIMKSNSECEVQKAHIANVDTFWQHTVVRKVEENLTAMERRRRETRRLQEEEQRSLDALLTPPEEKPVTNIYEDSSTTKMPYHTKRFIDAKGDGRVDVEEKTTHTGPKSLSEVAVLQNMTSYDLAFIHLQLADTLSLIFDIGITDAKIYTLFNDRCRAVFHKSLHIQFSLGNMEESSTINNNRLKFLTGALTQSIGTLSDNATREEFSNCHAQDCIDLGKLYGVKTDHLYRFQVIELYSHGMDSLAAEATLYVSEHTQLCQNLLLLAGCRYKHILDTSMNIGTLKAAMDPTLTLWVMGLNPSQLKNPNVSPSDSVTLLESILNRLPNTAGDFFKAESLLFAFKQYVLSLEDM